MEVPSVINSDLKLGIEDGIYVSLTVKFPINFINNIEQELSMNTIQTIFIVTVARILNGFYVLPIKKENPETNILWIGFALITFVIIPTVALFYSLKNGENILNFKELIIIFMIGIIYGFGVYLVAKSMSYIGIGIPFAISIALGTVSGSIFSLLISGKLFHVLSIGLITSYIFFAVSIILYSISVSIRDSKNNSNSMRGLIYCLVGSIFQATQGACLSYYSNIKKEWSNASLKAISINWLAIAFIILSIIFMCFTAT